MTEHPILFSGPMMRPILNCKPGVWPAEPINPALPFKWQTRRVIKPQPKYDPPKVQEVWKCPYGQPGDRLWVRETWAIVSVPDGTTARKSLTVFRADNPQGLEQPEKWKPSIHMPRWASRITLEMVDVRVERVQEIAGNDAIAEGWPKHLALFPTINPESKALEWFEKSWDSLNAKRKVMRSDMGTFPADFRPYSWEANPYIWVITFKVLP